MPQHPSWQSRRAGRLVLRFRERSLAAQDIDELETRFSEALSAVIEALDLDAAVLPPITVHLADRPPADEGHARPDDDGRAAPGGLSIWAAYSSDSPCVTPELELTHALLVHHLGHPGPAGRFWDEAWPVTWPPAPAAPSTTPRPATAAASSWPTACSRRSRSCSPRPASGSRPSPARWPAPSPST